jgi:hypothetical protein
LIAKSFFIWQGNWYKQAQQQNIKNTVRQINFADSFIFVIIAQKFKFLPFHHYPIFQFMKKNHLVLLLFSCLFGSHISAQADLNGQLNNLYYQLKGDLLCSNGQIGGTIRLFKNNDFVENRLEQPKSALYISANNSGFDLPDIKMKAATRFTIALWVYASKKQTITNFFGKTSDANLSIADAAGLKTAVFPSFSFLGEGKNNFPVQEWFFMTICYKDGTTTVFVNDEPTPRTKYSYNDFDKLNTSLDFGFGFTDDNKQTFIGSISNLHIFNTCLNTNDRQALYQRQEGVQPKEEPKPTPNIVVRGTDKNPPQIEVNDKTRDLGIATINSGSNINFSGNVIDQSGIKYVSINGAPAKINKIDEFKTTFDYNTSAQVGNNTFIVQAEDTHGNIATKTITINVAAPKSEPKPIKKDNPNAKILDEPTKKSLASAGFFALIIGVSDYEDESLTLDNTVRDAQKVQDILQRKYGFKQDNTVFLEDPDKEEIMEAFADLQELMNENDNLLIFYAGHGHWDKIAHKSYWLPADADKKVKTNWISSVEIADQLAALPAQHVLIVSDACFSGGFLKSRDISHESEEVYNALYRKKSRRIITSGDLETVPDESVFIKYFIKSLEQNNKDYFSEEDFFSDFKKAVIANSPNEQVPQNGTLQMAGDEGGNFIFRIDRNADNMLYEQPDREEEPQGPEEYGDDEGDYEGGDGDSPDVLISQTADCMCEKIDLVLKLKRHASPASEKEAIQNKIDAIMIEFSTCISEFDTLYRQLSAEEQTDINKQMESELNDKCGAALKELNAP